MTQPTVLILDDDDAFARAVGHIAMQEGFYVQLARTLRDARVFLGQHRIDLLMLDLELPDGSGLDLLGSLDLTQHGQVAIITGKPSVESAAQAVSSPVVEYLVKPLRPERLRLLLQRTMQRCSIPSAADTPLSMNGLAGKSPVMRQLVDTLCRIAPSDSPVLLSGESGTGKALAARAIHDASSREGAFVVFNCTSLAPGVVGSPLFGGRPGQDPDCGEEPGAFSRAGRGTLFLEDVDALPLALQSQLLRVIEEGEAARLGARPGNPSPRLLFSSRTDPFSRIADGSLSEDLYYSISALTLSLPPLRARGDDIVLLAEMFVRRLNDHYGQNKRLAPGADRDLLAHPWPGNIRELRGSVQRAYVLERTELLHIKPARRPAADAIDPTATMTFPLGTTLAEVERRVVLATLAHFEQDKAAAAAALGISVRTIYNHIARHALGAGPA
jgi:DNA-binding NtrC family response regulator